MKDLIEAAKKAVQESEELDYVRAGDVAVVPNLNFLPPHVRPPAVAIKDGRISRTELAGGMLEVTREVYFVLYVKLLKEEAPLLGDSENKGVLQMAEDLHELLDENELGIEGMLHAFSPAETESETVVKDGDVLQRKIVTYRYLTEEERP